MHPFDNALHLRLDTSRPKRSFEVLTCKGCEAPDRPYTFQLEILSPIGVLDAHALLFSTGYLYVEGSTSGIHGHVQSIVRSTTEPATSDLSQNTPMRYLITLGPRLGLMAYRHNQRIFQGMSAEQIITQVLGEHGIDEGAFFWHRKQPCQQRDYCAQYCESDLQLLQRLCREEQMHYYFLHTRTRHVVVFTDELPKDMLVEQMPEEVAQAPVSRLKASIPPLAPKMCMQRACVVGALFEPARLDDRGRIKVRFEWSNQGDGARFNDCWIPVDPALSKREKCWWGGMEVVVSFRDGNPSSPYISDRLWDPDINPRVQPDPASLARRVLTTRIDTTLFLDDSQQFSIDEQMIVRLAGDNEMHFRVGTSLVTIDAKSISLSGLRIMLSSIADAESAGARTDALNSGAGPQS